ncbi:hypothetical protein [Roseibium sp.]|uniref:hypothetical protein n=1 Tax=Roseibium sp. TaxID=1936156 RepID=UPI003BAADF1C
MTAANKLILRPDLAKLYLWAIGESAVAGAAVSGVVYMLLGQLELNFFVYLAIGIAVGAIVLFTLRRPRADTFIELSREAIRLVEGHEEQVHAWQDVSRFTLQEGIVKDRRGQEHIRRHYLAARLLDGNSTDQDRDAPVQPGESGLLFPVDKYISNHRYSDRNEDAEAACSSPERFAETVNAWRDFALDLEIGSVPTPTVQVDDDRATEFMQKISIKLGT